MNAVLCIFILSETDSPFARVGCIMLVSHLNAHAEEGVDWLEEIVVKGLRAAGGKEAARWEIEVHGNSGLQEEADEEEIDPTSSVSPGPAVYIIHKKPPSDSPSGLEEPTVPLKFFGY